MAKNVEFFDLYFFGFHLLRDDFKSIKIQTAKTLSKLPNITIFYQLIFRTFVLFWISRNSKIQKAIIGRAFKNFITHRPATLSMTQLVLSVLWMC